MSKLSRWGSESSLKKDERKFKLKTLIKQKKVLTVTACAKEMNLSKNTIRTYLTEMKMAIYDDEKNDLTKHDDTYTIIYPF